MARLVYAPSPKWAMTRNKSRQFTHNFNNGIEVWGLGLKIEIEAALNRFEYIGSSRTHGWESVGVMGVMGVGDKQTHKD